MAGTKEGGRRAAATNKAKYGDDFYKQIGKKGGSNSHNGGFASLKVGSDGLTGRQRASLVGSIGGLRSDRTGIGTGEGKSKASIAKYAKQRLLKEAKKCRSLA